MSIAGAYRAALRRSHRIERRSRRRLTRDTAVWLAGIFAWCAVFLALGWLVAVGFYGLLVNV
jgi:polyferredoxin